MKSEVEKKTGRINEKIKCLQIKAYEGLNSKIKIIKEVKEKSY